jgi:hypothetical protein
VVQGDDLAVFRDEFNQKRAQLLACRFRGARIEPGRQHVPGGQVGRRLSRLLAGDPALLQKNAIQKPVQPAGRSAAFGTVLGRPGDCPLQGFLDCVFDEFCRRPGPPVG